MPKPVIPGDALVATWRTNNRVTTFLFESLPSELWPKRVPGAPRRTVRMIAGHIHNARCMWIKTLGAKHGIAVPRSVDRRKVRRDELLRALARSSEGMVKLLELGLARGGRLPGRPAWWPCPTDLAHSLGYFLAHEAHHRGQVCMLARELGHRLPAAVTAGLWQWSRREKEWTRLSPATPSRP